VWGGNIEFLMLNATDPNKEVDGERSSLKTKHPAFSDPAVRHAMHLLCDLDSMEKYVYGRTAKATANVVNGPPRFVSPTAKWEFNVNKAIEMLDQAGWKPGSDGIRVKDGVPLKFVFQTSINAPRQKCQQVIKQAAQKAGISLELKSVTAAVFFSSDVANPDTYTKFYADMEMYTNTMLQPDPANFIRMFCSWEVATKENKWQGTNINRWQSPEFDAIFTAVGKELDPVKRAAMCIQLNDLAVAEYCKPLLWRSTPNAVGTKLKVSESGWDTILCDMTNWYREA
jgi:peptide/nickel transport system substrate-binding protein